MNHIHALSGAYAVDALDDSERTEFEEHLAECAECRAEVASFRETAALLAETEDSTPPESLRKGVLDRIGRVRPLPPETPPRPQPMGPTVVRRRWLPQLLAAAAAVVLLAGGIAAWHPWQDDRTTLADQILQAPDAMTVTEKLPGGAGELALVRSASLQRAVLVGHGVAPPPDGKTYQMWLQQPGEDMVSAGLMTDAEKPTVLTGDAATATAAAVSVEPETGSPHPTSPPIAVFPLTHPAGGGAS
jgi:anti-sigma-K factor RskA